MRLMLRLMALYRPYWHWALLAFAVSLATLLANFALMAVSGWFITAMAIAGAAGTTINYFAPAAIIRACAIIRTGGRYVERLVTHETTFRFLSRFRVWLYRQVEPQPPAVLDAYHSGDLASRLRSDVDRLETVYLRLLNPLAVALAAIAVVLSVLARYSLSFALMVGTCLALAGFLVPMAVARLSSRWGRERVQQATHLTEAAVDGLQGMGELLAFGDAGRRQSARFAAASRRLIATQVRLGHLAGSSQAAILLAANIATLGVLVLAIPMVRDGSLERPDFVMAAMLTLASFEAITPLPAAFQALGGVLESARRLFALADDPPAQGPCNGIAVPPEHCDVELHGVTFRYGADSPPVIAGFDLVMAPGDRIAVVGPTGAGKSTLVALLTGLRRPEAGAIRLGGRPLDDYEPEALRRCFAVAPQDPSLFTGTIRDNLLLANSAASEDELWRALATAQLDGFVRSLSEGLDTYVGEAGLTLSGGQARRLAVARALLREAPILILDEPGEGLDYRTERSLLASIAAGLGDRSLILITHRRAGLDLVGRVITLPG